MDRRRRENLANWLVAVAVVAVAAGSIIARRLEVDRRESSREAANGLAIMFDMAVADADAAVAECVAATPCTDPAVFFPRRDIRVEAWNSSLMHEFFPEYDQYLELTYEWNHSVMAVIDENGVITDPVGFNGLAEGHLLTDISAELASALQQLEKRREDDLTAARWYGWLWKGLLVSVVLMPLLLTAVRWRRRWRQDIEWRTANASAAATPGTTSTPLGPSSTNVS